jgi:putative transcriptional regulator
VTSLQGQLLVAQHTLADSNFFHSLVLVVQHNDEGALGLILNRPTRTTVADLCTRALNIEDPTREGLVMQGGPCDGPLMMVHEDESLADIRVLPGLAFTTDRAKLEGLLKDSAVRGIVCVGYSGWSAGQLESEIAEGSWLCIPISASEALDPTLTWEQCFTRAVLQAYVPPDRMPRDPRLN